MVTPPTLTLTLSAPPPVALVPTAAQPAAMVLETSILSFEPGTLVDSLVDLPNGTSRWFPGKIICLNADGTVDVEFDDGEVHRGKPQD